MRSKGGFTIVELLIVIVVIAVLAAISIVTYRGIVERAYSNRAVSELSAMARATKAYHAIHDKYPDDVDRGVPAEVTELINGSTSNWPKAPWPNSVYDYDNWIDDVTGEETVQMSIRFCPIDASDLDDCTFPNEPWAAGFQKDSSYYWCIQGTCKAHSSKPADYPGKCANCKE